MIFSVILMCGFQARFTDDNVVSHCREVGHTCLMTNPLPRAPNVSFILSAKGWETVLLGAKHSILRQCLAFFPSFLRDSAGIASVCHYGWLV